MEKLECPACGGEMARAIQDLRYVYKGKPLVVPALDALVCASCGEALFATPEDGARYDAAIRAHISAVNLNSAPEMPLIIDELAGVLHNAITNALRPAYPCANGMHSQIPR